jgi:CelD/BcsL family acetyltransferase involved in cellulose biosynthesis
MSIRVEICPPNPRLTPAWEDLVQRGPANAFLHPAALNAAYASGIAKIHTLLAWRDNGATQQLVGLWALQETKLAPLWPTFLAAPPYEYAFVANPVIDLAVADEVIAAFFDAIASAAALPTVLVLKNLDGECETYAAIERALIRRGSPMLKLSVTARPFAHKEAGLKRSGSTRKKLRQDWNRLAGLGAVEVSNDRAPDRVRDAFEVFLALEAGSWKGARGTALLSIPHHAAFARRWIGDLAHHGNASVALLRVGERPIAAQVLLYCGSMAYTWKTAFDADYARHSPGAVLIDKLTEQLFAAGNIAAIESCSVEGSFLGQLWTGRRRRVDLLADVGAGKSLNFVLAALGERGYAQLRDWRNRLRTAFPQTKKALAASR